MASQILLLVLLKVLNLVGLVFLCFGTSYAHTLTLVVVLYGAEKARQGVGTALAFYCIYIPFVGRNGVCEAEVHAMGNEHELPHRHLSNGFMNGLALSYHSRPHPLVLTAFFLSLLVTTTSQRVLLHSEMKKTGSLVPHLVHLTVGTLVLRRQWQRSLGESNFCCKLNSQRFEISHNTRTSTH
ncbi:hypothetical protein PsorP6_002857 [Peronosclerospora sorghi]|uniref:Uncharacterized protein n=1 Tax=Peronosclerospora sorghi TaxID=230839 RepID=A0ACC0VL29_9STRA|nr:hypothetical protein PsorP6_002857 [Peronosclerospora sorghi]